ncbi:MAG: hypothetical protein ACREA0_25810, partial [bacterium]
MGKSKQTAEVYSRHHRTARRYGYTFGGIASDRIEALRQWSGRGKQILAVGCRDGLLSEQLAAPGNNVIGVDIDWEALRLGVE